MKYCKIHGEYYGEVCPHCEANARLEKKQVHDQQVLNRQQMILEEDRLKKDRSQKEFLLKQQEIQRREEASRQNSLIQQQELLDRNRNLEQDNREKHELVSDIKKIAFESIDKCDLAKTKLAVLLKSQNFKTHFRYCLNAISEYQIDEILDTALKMTYEKDHEKINFHKSNYDVINETFLNYFQLANYNAELDYNQFYYKGLLEYLLNKVEFDSFSLYLKNDLDSKLKFLENNIDNIGKLGIASESIKNFEISLRDLDRKAIFNEDPQYRMSNYINYTTILDFIKKSMDKLITYIVDEISSCQKAVIGAIGEDREKYLSKVTDLVKENYLDKYDQYERQYLKHKNTFRKNLSWENISGLSVGLLLLGAYKINFMVSFVVTCIVVAPVIIYRTYLNKKISKIDLEIDTLEDSKDSIIDNLRLEFCSNYKSNVSSIFSVNKVTEFKSLIKDYIEWLNIHNYMGKDFARKIENLFESYLNDIKEETSQERFWQLALYEINIKIEKFFSENEQDSEEEVEDN